MADKTIPQLNEATTLDENTLLPIDSGIQTYKMTAPNLAHNLEKFKPGIPRWNTNWEYLENDLVNYEGIIHRAKVDNTGVNPSSDITKWIPERFVTEIDLSTDPNKGAFTAGLLHVAREGNIVTISGQIFSAAFTTAIDSANNLLPAWALPKVTYGGDNAHAQTVDMITPEDIDEPVVRVRAVVGNFLDKTRVLRVYGSVLGVWPNTAYNPASDMGSILLSMSYIGAEL